MAQGAPSRAAAGGLFETIGELLSIYVVLMLGLVRPFLRKFRLLFRTSSIFISVVGTSFRLSSIRWQLFSACNSLFIGLLGVLPRGGTTVSSFSVAIALVSTGRAILWHIVSLLCGRITRSHFGGTRLPHKQLL